MIGTILGFVMGLLLIPTGMVFLTLSLCLIAVDMLVPGGRPHLLYIFPVGAALLIFGGLRLIRGRHGIWTFIQIFMGLSIIAFMCYLYRPLIEKAIPHLAQAHQIAKAKKAPGSQTADPRGQNV